MNKYKKVLSQMLNKINNNDMLDIVKIIKLFIKTISWFVLFSIIQKASEEFVKNTYWADEISFLYKFNLFDITFLILKVLISLMIVIAFLFGVLYLFNIINEFYKNNDNSKHETPFFIAYNVTESKKNSDKSVKCYIEEIYKKYLKKYIYTFENKNCIYTIIGTATQAELNTQEKRKDALITDFLIIKFRNIGGLCTKLSIDNFSISGIEYKRNSKIDNDEFLIDLSKVTQELTMVISEVFVAKGDLEGIMFEDNECEINFTIISTNIFSKRYEQCIEINRVNKKWEFRTDEVTKL